MVKIYQKKGNQLTGTQIRMPERPSNVLGNILGQVSAVTKKLSEENFKLGKAQLINSVLTEAYNQAPENPKLFNELVQTGFKKTLNGLDDSTKEKIYTAANDSVKQLQIKVGNNLNARLDKENSERIKQLADDALYGVNGVEKTNEQIANMLSTGLGLDGEPLTREEFDGMINQRNKAIARLKALSQAKNLKGGYIIGDKATRKAIETENFGMGDTILNSLSDMDYDTLKNFDEKVFQDKKAFMEKTGLNLKEYNDLSGKIKKYRKDLNKEDERILTDQAKFNTVAAVHQRNVSLLEEQKSRLPKDIYEKLKKVAETKTDKQEYLITNEDEAFLKQFNAVMEIADTQYDGNKNFDEKLLSKYADAMESLDKYRTKYGTDDEDDKITDTMMYNAMTDNLFGQVLGTIEKTSAFGQLLEKSKIVEEEARERANYQFGYERNLIRADLQMTPEEFATTILPYDENKEKTLAQENRIAASTAMRLSQYGTLLSQTADEEQRQSILNNAVAEIDKANVEIIKTKMTPLISPKEFDRCMREHNAGGKPMFTNKRNGRTYRFAGITDNGIIITEE